MILPVYTNNNPVLREKAKPVQEINDQIDRLALDMRETMLNAKGIGLAAPQIGQSIAMITIEISEKSIEDIETIPKKEQIPFTVLINPRITWYSMQKVRLAEGCLSVPGKEAYLIRPSKVRVKALNIEGKEFEIQAEGLLARLLQHEIDHLNGILFTDKVVKKDLINVPLVDYPKAD